MNYPRAIIAFCMRLNGDGRTVAAMAVLVPGIGEIIGGSQREERLEVLDRNMAERRIDREHYAWYRDLRRYGTVPHAGSASPRLSPSAPSRTSPASPTCATRSPSQGRRESRGIDAYYFSARVFVRSRLDARPIAEGSAQRKSMTKCRADVA